jgi:hypothetical protein
MLDHHHHYETACTLLVNLRRYATGKHRISPDDCNRMYHLIGIFLHTPAEQVAELPAAEQVLYYAQAERLRDLRPKLLRAADTGRHLALRLDILTASAVHALIQRFGIPQDGLYQTEEASQKTLANIIRIIPQYT